MELMNYWGISVMRPLSIEDDGWIRGNPEVIGQLAAFKMESRYDKGTNINLFVLQRGYLNWSVIFSQVDPILLIKEIWSI